MIATVLEQLVETLEPWSNAVSNSTALSAGLTFVHLGAMMIGGGLAIGADRLVLKAPRAADATTRRAVADAVGDVHRVVIIALTCALITGLLQVAADLESLSGNWILWVKAALVASLCANGVVMVRDERAVRQAPQMVAPFLALRVRAATSIALWMLIVLAGVGLMQG